MSPARISRTTIASLVALALIGGAAAAQAGTTHRRPRPQIGPPHRLIPYQPTQPCIGSGPTPATGWCSYYDGATSGTGGSPVVLSMSVCRLPGLPAGTLSSDNGQQFDFAVGIGANAASWTWSTGRTFPSNPTAVSVPAGMCAQWYVTWRVVDDAGHALAPGSYWMSPDPLMEPQGDNATVSFWNTETFTVR